jgi:hypothetical protein
MTVGINNHCFLIRGSPDIRKIVQVDMAVNKVFGSENPHKGKKGLKPPMTPVFLVVDPLGRRVGQENIEKTAPENAVKNKRRKEF